MSILQKMRNVFRRSPPSPDDLEGLAESARLRDEQETIRLSQRSAAGENYQSGRGSKQ
ncbi:MAG: hypothetical protein QOH16_3402 [Gaiellaceae bacterium]|nr:hypothetical protein [Gaiellaceae bacterium]